MLAEFMKVVDIHDLSAKLGADDWLEELKG